MQIHELNELSRAPQTGDVLAIDTGTDTAKIDYNALATAIINKLGGDPVTIPHGGTNATTADGACENIGAVKKAGDTMTGDLSISGYQSPYPSLFLIPTSNDTTNRTVLEGSYEGASSIGAWEDSTASNRRMIEVRNAKYEPSTDNAVVLRICVNNSWTAYRVFHSGMATPIPVAQGGTGMTGVTNGRTTAIGNYISGGDIYVNWCKWGPVVSVSGWFPIGTDVPVSEAFMTLPFAPIVYGAATAVNSNGTASRALYWNANEKKLRARDVALPTYWWYTSFAYMTNE